MTAMVRLPHLRWLTALAVLLSYLTLTGLGLWRLLREHAELQASLVAAREETAGRLAAVLGDSVTHCWEQVRLPNAVPDAECTGVTDAASPYRWLRYPLAEPATHAVLLDTAAADVALSACLDLPQAARLLGCRVLASTLAERGSVADLRRLAPPLLTAVGSAQDALLEYRQLSYRVLALTFADALQRAGVVLERESKARPNQWLRVGRFLVTKPCAHGPGCSAWVGLDTEVSQTRLRRFANALNVTGYDRYRLSVVRAPVAVAQADTTAYAVISAGLGFVSVVDADTPPGLANLQMLLGGYAAVAAILLAALLTALWLVEQSARDLRHKQNFVASVSHELRTPLGSVRLMLDTLLAHPELSAERLHGYLQSMHGQVVRLSRMAENMLLLQRLERHPRGALVRCVVGELVNQVFADQRAEAQAKRVSLKLDASAQLTAIRAEPNLLGAALANLVQNAIKFAPADSLVEVTGVETANAVELRVRDQGPGIAKAERERVFGWFYRSGDELTRETQGTGVGLAVVRAVAAWHGGRAFIAEVSGPGCCAVLALPKEAAAEGEHGS